MLEFTAGIPKHLNALDAGETVPLYDESGELIGQATVEDRPYGAKVITAKISDENTPKILKVADQFIGFSIGGKL